MEGGSWWKCEVVNCEKVTEINKQGMHHCLDPLMKTPWPGVTVIRMMGDTSDEIVDTITPLSSVKDISI